MFYFKYQGFGGISKVRRTVATGCETVDVVGTHFLYHSDTSNSVGEVSTSVAIVEQSTHFNVSTVALPICFGAGDPTAAS
jgi:hypothetical protein